jgi:outer membrane protein assembly factor BamB
MLELLSALAPLLIVQAPAGDWAQFRGPGGRAVADDTPIPTDFGPDKRVLWKATLPAGHSSPCIAGGRIFLTGFEEGKDIVVALARADGKSLWTKAFEPKPDPAYFHPDAGPVLATPVADAERVIVSFGNYGLVALDHDGKLLWEKRLAHPGYVFGVGASPLLYDGILILARDGAPEAGVLALDATDGSELWRIRRFEFRESHGTPFLWQNADRTELVLGGSGRLCGYDPGTGERLWSVGGLTAFPCTTPTGDKDTLFYAAWSTPNATGRSFWEAAFERSLDLSEAEVADPTLIFARLDQDKDGKIVVAELPECRAKDSFGVLDGDRSGAWELAEFKSATTTTAASGENLMVAVPRGLEGDGGPERARWSWKRGLPYVSSPLVYRNRVWLCQSGGLVSALDAMTGEPVIDRTRLSDRAEYYLSPVGAAGHVLVGSAEGTLFLLAADAAELTIEHTVTFPEGLFATPAVLGGIVYLRTAHTLYAFGAAGGK